MKLSKKMVIIIGGVSLGLIVLGSIFAATLDFTNVKKGNFDVTSSSMSADALNDAYTIEFTLGKGDVCKIEFRCLDANDNVKIFIVAKESYDSEMGVAAPATPAVSALEAAGALDYVTYEYAYSSNPAFAGSRVASSNIAGVGVVYFDFMGDASGTDLVSVPGDYVIVIEGQDTVTAANNAQCYISVKKSGIGNVLGGIFTAIGIIGLIFAVVVGIQSRGRFLEESSKRTEEIANE